MDECVFESVCFCGTPPAEELALEFTATPISVNLEVDQSIHAVVAELAGLPKPFIKCSPQLFANVINGLINYGVELFSIKQLPALRAGELRFNLEPSGGLLEFMAAFRAGEIKSTLSV